MPLERRIFMMVVKASLYIVKHAQLLEQTDILEGSRNACLIDLDGAFSGNILSIQDDTVRASGLYTPVRRLKMVVFTGAVRSDQAVKLSFFDREC